MIHRPRENTVPPSLIKKNRKNKTETDRAVDKFNKHIADNKKAVDFHFDFKVYKATDVKDALHRIFFGKCAYCESRYAGTQPMDVEHWRPKGEVHLDDGTKLPGYYWLAATWTNLLPSCIDCNRERNQYDARAQKETKLGKANRFPVSNVHLVSTVNVHPHELDPENDGGDEDPLLLNPCNENPEEYFQFDSEDGIVRSRLINGQPIQKAETSIMVYGLNRRELVLDRLEIIRLIQHRIYTIERITDLLDVSQGYELNEETRLIIEEILHNEIEALMELQDEKKQFSGMAAQIIGSYTKLSGYLSG